MKRGGKLVSALFLSGVVVLVFACQPRAPERASGPTTSAIPNLPAKPKAPIVFLSTQMNPVEEASKMRTSILGDFPGTVDFRPNDNSLLFSQIDAMLAKDHSQAILIGALHGDLSTLRDKGELRPLGDVLSSLPGRTFIPSLVGLSRFGGEAGYYVPWMQASFVMVANRKALPYLPSGATLDTLTYDQLLQWAKNISDRTGKKVLGFPAGQKGLMHRFFQGYLYPSFTASTLLKFRSAEAQSMWAYFRDLWRYVHPGSLVYSTMAEPLLTGDVWIAWDHTARLVKALQSRPEDFVAFPAPRGPHGRGFMAIVAGLALPARSADVSDPLLLVDYLTLPEVQARTLNETGFFPVLSSTDKAAVPPYLAALGAAVAAQSSSPDSILSLPPAGLGARDADFNYLYMLTFSEIVLEGKSIPQVLDAKARELQAIIDQTDARSWLPDVSGDRPCKIE